MPASFIGTLAVIDRRTNPGEFSEESLIELVHERHRQPLPSIGDVIADAVADWTSDAEQPDEVAVVLARACLGIVDDAS